MEHNSIVYEFAVMDAWKSNMNDIRKWWFVDNKIQDIRYIRRKDELILQKSAYVEVEFNKEILIDENFCITDTKLVWLDVLIDE
jgi:hypothetical protein